VRCAATTIRDAPAANDNAYTTGKPVVRVPRGRADATYARSDNVLLPLRFARRMTGWHPRVSSS
jgi:hypothetical protein